MPSPSAKRRAPLFVAAAIVLVVVLGLVAWNNGLEDQLFPKNFGVVEAGEIYRSGRLTERMLRKVIEDNRIHTVIDFGGWDPGTPEAAMEADVCAELGADREVLPLQGDGTGDPNRYVEALRIMADPARRPVLVHCAAGSERTGAAVMLYRHIVEGEPLEDAFPDARAHGHDPSRNPRLLLYLAEWADDIEASYDDGQPITWPPPAGPER